MASWVWRSQDSLRMRIMVLSFLLMLDVGCFSIVSRCAVESRIQELELIQPKTVSSAAGPAIGIRVFDNQ